MRNAPAVHYPVGRCRFHGWLVLIASCLGFVAITGWNLAVQAAPVLAWSSAAVFAVLVANAGHRWHATRPGELVWTGQVWRFASLNRSAETTTRALLEVKVVLDLQSTMLIRLSGPRGAIFWLWSERRQLAVRWLAHRRALFASSRTDRVAKPLSPSGKGRPLADTRTESSRHKP